MMTEKDSASLEEQIGQWRSYLLHRQAIHTVDVAELEDHLREQVASLVGAGLSTDEAFLVGVKRMGALDALSREFAREHSERLWKQLVVVPEATSDSPASSRRDTIAAFAFATAAGVAIKLPSFLGMPMTDDNEAFYLRNASLFVLPFLTGYFIWKRSVNTATLRWLAVALVAAVVAINGQPFAPKGSTEILAALHLPMALWLGVGIAYAGGRWNEVAGRMDFIRFSGELFIYFVLIALGGGVLTGFVNLIFGAIGINVEPFIEAWMPSLVAGAVGVAAWLVEAKQSVIENMAPVLTRLFTPMFATLLIVFLATMLFTGRGINVEREVLIAFDLLLAVVVGLMLYSISARDPRKPPGTFDIVQVVLVVAALVTDVVALWAMAARISDFGFTPNRVAALGENVILLANLSWSAVLYIRFVRGRATSLASLERWQTSYLPVYAAWAALVVLVFPIAFGFR
jgi:hypothetical protein